MLYVIATRIRFMCPMHFNKFPMDTQTCKFQVVEILDHNSEMIAFLDSETLKYAFFCSCFMVDCNILVSSYMLIIIVKFLSFGSCHCYWISIFSVNAMTCVSPNWVHLRSNFFRTTLIFFHIHCIEWTRPLVIFSEV